VLEVAVSCVAVAGGEGAGVVADLDEVAELVVGLVGVRLVPVVAVVGRHRLQADGEVPAVGEGEQPVGAPVGVARWRLLSGRSWLSGWPGRPGSARLGRVG